jgi:hypothetical protein
MLIDKYYPRIMASLAVFQVGGLAFIITRELLTHAV